MILDQRLGRFNYGYDASVITKWDLWVDFTFAKVGAHQVKPTPDAYNKLLNKKVTRIYPTSVFSNI